MYMDTSQLHAVPVSGNEVRSEVNFFTFDFTWSDSRSTSPLLELPPEQAVEIGPTPSAHLPTVDGHCDSGLH